MALERHKNALWQAQILNPLGWGVIMSQNPLGRGGIIYQNEWTFKRIAKTLQVEFRGKLAHCLSIPEHGDHCTDP